MNAWVHSYESTYWTNAIVDEDVELYPHPIDTTFAVHAPHIIPTWSNDTYNISVTWLGDVNLSHSAQQSVSSVSSNSIRTMSVMSNSITNEVNVIIMSEIVERSILEFEYHADMARWMGYGNTWHDNGFKINVHLSGKGGPAKFLRTLGRLSPEARNLITIENDEMTNGLDTTLAVAQHVALVLDLHHHWINSGEYITAQDDRVKRVIDSWRGTRPALHYSVSREDVLVDHDRGTRPDLAELLARGYKKQKLRAHSDFYWNDAVTDWALTFADNFDIQCEAKGKNLASEQVYERYIA